MLFFSFLGCDGSGKSAVIRRLKERLSNDDVTVMTGHWRPRAFSRETAAEGLVVADNPHGEVPRGYLSSILKLGWLVVNWWVGWIRLRSKLGKSGVLMFDRYHADLLVDPRRYRYGGPAFLARIACRLMPQPDRVFFLDSLGEIVLKRRHDHGGEGVVVGPTALPLTEQEDWLVQERVRMDRLAVRTLAGFEGTVSHDLALHVCYDYDLLRRELVHCEVSGYLARFARSGDVVNISQGGGVIPVLVEGPAA